ncbi:SGNH/GDSL hydrolase family protein [Microbulbifer sp. ARAS458-1]|uniref:SGNH/GDSL hydrolase family protein n=1 Tax=Microbulbifer sp. ARAS458-1 TaxID=3140242 RepID=UPI003877CB93
MIVSAIKPLRGICTALFVSAFFNTSAFADPIDYVALGDSYASGVGELGLSYNQSCPQTDKGYPTLLAGELGAAGLEINFGFQACGGARTLVSGAFDTGIGVPSVYEGQLQALSADTDLVTLTIGGNDVGFIWLVLDCLISYGQSACANELNTSQGKIANDLPAMLDTLFSAISESAPNAAVIVTGYARPFKANGSYWCWNANLLSRTNQKGLNSVVDNLNYRIATAAYAKGFQFVDPSPYFSGHDICSSSSYLSHTRNYWPQIGNIAHPTADGYEFGYMPGIRALLGL